MLSGKDINRISGDGYLIVPISMSRMSNGQNPQKCYEVADYFVSKLEQYSNDVIFLYTNGLYFNLENTDFKSRAKMNQQLLDHKINLWKIIKKDKKYIPGAFHFLPIDYVILNSVDFVDFFVKLKKLEKIDSKFRYFLQKDLDKVSKDYNEANLNFLFEEICVAHIIRQKFVSLPRTLVKNDIWRLMVYHGECLESEVYVWQQRTLPQTEKNNPYAGAQYDFERKEIQIFDEIVLK